MTEYPKTYAHYVLLERLGVGGMSEVDLARNRVDDGSFVRFAVIKRIKADYALDASFVRMFKDEARITSELHHENIGAVYDFGRVGDEYYLALEYVPGIDLRFLVNTLRERGQRVPVKVALKVVVEVLDALSYAHDKKDTFGKPMGIVHRDVNPRNVMMSIRGEVKLIDFGVAKATDRLEQTRADHVKGKFAYMAPEQLTAGSVDQRSDLYAVGLVLHELLAGVSPYYGLNQVQILHRMVNGTIPELPEIPEIADPTELQRVHTKALAADPDVRYATAEDFAADLREVGDQIGGLPTADQLAGFLNAVDPELTLRLRRKMEDYARVDLQDTELLVGRGAGPAPVELPPPAPGPGDVHSGSSSLLTPSASGTMARQVQASMAADTSSVARRGLMAGSVLLVSVVSALVAGAIVAAALLGRGGCSSASRRRRPRCRRSTRSRRPRRCRWRLRRWRRPRAGAVAAAAVSFAAVSCAAHTGARAGSHAHARAERRAGGPEPRGDLLDPFDGLPVMPAPAAPAGEAFGFLNVEAPDGAVEVRVDGEARRAHALLRLRLPPARTRSTPAAPAARPAPSTSTATRSSTSSAGRAYLKRCGSTQRPAILMP
ncbi:MAG: serine/threonine-protein kinase [Myxococcota bacterium]